MNSENKLYGTYGNSHGSNFNRKQNKRVVTKLGNQYLGFHFCGHGFKLPASVIKLLWPALKSKG